MISQRVASALLLSSLISTVASGQPPGLAEIHVNPENPIHSGDLYLRTDAVPWVSMDAEGRFVVAWKSGPPPVGAAPILVRSFAADGTPISGELPLAFGRRASVASTPQGFVLVWTGEVQRIFARLFTVTGEPLTEEIRINPSVAYTIRYLEVASDPGGGFVVVWDSFQQDGDGKGIFARRFNAEGEPLSEELHVNTVTAGNQRAPTVATAKGGDFVVVWESDHQDGSGWGVFARRFASGGEPLTGELQINTSTSRDQDRATVASDADGDFMVVWTDDAQTGRDEVFGRRFSSAGEPLTGEFRINSFTVGRQFDPQVRCDTEGNFLVAWLSPHPDTFERFPATAGNFARYFSNTAAPQGGEFRVSMNLRTGSAAIASDGNGNYVAVYKNLQNLYARRLPAHTRAGALHFVSAARQLEVEHDGTASIPLMRSGGGSGELAVDYFLEGGSAEPGEDFRAFSGRLNFTEDGSLDPLTLDIELLDDSVIEGEENLIVRLVPVAEAELLGLRTSEIALVDNDFNPPELEPAVLVPEKVVNSEPGFLGEPAVAISPNGDFAVAWKNIFEGVFVQAFDPTGRLKGQQTRAHPSPPSDQVLPSILYEDASSFVVLWNRINEKLIEGRRFNSRGQRGDRFQIELDCPPGDGVAPEPCRFLESARLVGTFQDHLFAVWLTDSPESNDWFLKRALIGRDNSLQIETLVEGSLFSRLAAASAPGGRSIVAWRERPNWVAQPFDAVGDAQDTFQLRFPDFASNIDLALAEDGELISSYEDEDSIWVRRYRPRGRPSGDPFLVPNFSLGRFFFPAMAAGPRSHFVVTWEQGFGPSEDGSGNGVFARRFNRAWGPVGGEFRVNSTTRGDQKSPEVAVGPDGSFVITWLSEREDGEQDVMVQRFAPFTCVPDERTLCLQNGRFRLEVEWLDFEGKTGHGRAADPLTRDTGYFWFFDRDNVELVVKILDGRQINGSYWVFYGSLSNVGYTLEITDTMTGEKRRYTNPLGELASVADDDAFPGDELGWDSTVTAVDSPMTEAAPIPSPEAKGGGCTADATHLCLNGGRFELEIRWRDFVGQTGVGQTVPITDDTGYFWFFADFNIEVVVKVLDGRAVNGNFWVFYGALSDVEYTLVVRDTITGRVREYFNPLFRSASVADTAAFPGG